MGTTAIPRKAIEGIPLPVATFGLKDTNDYYAGNIAEKKGRLRRIRPDAPGEKAGGHRLSVPGEHNIYNALAAAATAHTLGVSPEDIAKKPARFYGGSPPV